MPYNFRERFAELLPGARWPSWPPQMPFVDFHQMNLDWILEAMRAVLDQMKYYFIDGGSKETIEEVMEDHPEWWPRVQDGAITSAQINSGFLKEIENAYVTPEMFGAVGDGVADDTEPLQSALANSNYVYIPKGKTYKITDTLTISGNKIIVINGDINALTENAAILILGARNLVTGSGTITGNDIGVGILFGGENKTDYSNFNTLDGINIQNFDTCVSIYNNQLQGLTTYFNILTNLNIRHARIGAGLFGYANANQISKCIFVDCGTNDTTGGAIVYKNIGVQFPLDNSTSQIFHHQSENAITLNIEKANYSMFDCIVCEQGGSNAKSIVITDTETRGCQFYVTSNVAAYRTIPTVCERQNVFIDIAGSIVANTITARGNVLIDGLFTLTNAKQNKPLSITAGYRLDGIAENTTLELFTVNKTLSTEPVVYRVKCLIGSGTQATSLRKYAEGVVFYDGLPSSSVTVLNNIGNKDITATADGVVSVHCGNNGTNTTRGTIFIEIEQICNNTNGLNTKRYTPNSSLIEM